MHPLLRQTSHRTAPLPKGPWIMLQTWHDLLFCHWRIPIEELRPLVPAEFALDLFDGEAWVAVAPFWMSGVRARFTPPLPGLSRFPELNVRTYVRYNTVPGVYFFSLDASNALAVRAARAGYHLPYFLANMSVAPGGPKFRDGSSRFVYLCRRLEDPRPAEFWGSYWPTSGPRMRDKGSLEHFLTERYCLYTTHKHGVYRAYIHHMPWALQDAEAEIEHNTMAAAAGINLPADKPLLHYSRRLDVLIWPIEKLST